ncbi:MAG: NUDIX hydrolase N-terminal domain-containing protein [Chloroflexota bacterium]
MSSADIAQQLALWADKLRDVSSSGLRFSSNIYDKENYQAAQNVAMEMLALASGVTVDEIEPLRTPHFSRPTPLSVGDAAVIDTQGRILLIQRADNAMWAMPGGMFEVGESPAEGAVRETFEETGVHCRAKSFIGVFDSRLMAGKSRFHLYHFTFLCEPIPEKPEEPAPFAHETLGVGWFTEDGLPTSIDPGHVTRIPKAFDMWRNGGPAFFDNPANVTE